jgi:hypothetical protein
MLSHALFTVCASKTTDFTFSLYQIEQNIGQIAQPASLSRRGMPGT